MPPKVSINLCCYNSEKYLEETLQSIFAQTCTDWELVIVNDGSTDSTEEIIKRYMKNEPRIICHYQPNAGLGNARNKAVGLSSGEFIALIDHDDLWMPTKLETQIRMFDKNPKLGLVYCDGYTVDSQGHVILRYSKKHPLARGNIFDKLIRSSFIPPSGAVIKRRVFDEWGPFCPFGTVEEYDLFLKVAYRCEVDYAEEPLFKYRSHEGNLSLTGDRELLHQETIAIRKYWMELTGVEDKNRAELMKRLLARAFASYGIWLLERGRREKARQNLRFSLKLYPVQLRFLHYLLTWLPPSLGSSLLGGLRGVKTCLMGIPASGQR